MEKDDAGELGQSLREYRLRHDLTQRRLAELAGVSVRTVRSIEHGQEPRLASRRQLTAVLTGTAPRAAAKELRIDLLGPLRVYQGGTAVTVGSTRQRSLLGLLALHANQNVSRSEIVDLLWDDRPPATYRTVLHSMVSRLRKTLLTGGDPVITSQHDGYTLRVAPQDLDLLRFDDLTTQARQAPNNAEALKLFTAALDCWRAPVLAGQPERVRQHPTAIAAAQRRLSTVLTYADTALRAGAFEEAAARLRTLVHDEPLHEGLHARLMLALAGLGQQAAALTLFSDVQDRLHVELAVEPGAELRAAHLKVLRGQVSTPVVRQRTHLPRDLPDFTGRVPECRELLKGPTAAAVTVIDGMAGVGKTVLAVHIAHQLAPRYPDGQLFLDLHGYTVGRRPVPARDALESLLRQCGVEGERIPERVDDCAALWRALAADRRLLVVFDNAADAAQLRPLLPNGRQTRTLVTSRGRLASLDGVHHLSVDVLPHTDAATLFARAFGRSVAGQDDAVAEVVRLCGFLPLAVRVAAAKARAHPAWTVSHLTDRLSNERRRLAELEVGDRSVDAAFSLSYRLLGAQQRRMFRLLGVSFAHHFDAYTAAAIAGIPHAAAQRVLDDLLGAHLLLEPAPGRFKFHDLLRQHARAAALRHDPDLVRELADVRLIDYFLHTANRAADLLEPSRRRFDPGEPAVDLPRFSGQADAVAWLETEHHNLVTATFAAATSEMWNHCWQLAQSLWRCFCVRGQLQDWITTHEVALQAATLAGDPRARAETHKNLGIAHLRRADLAKALEHQQEALVLDEADADPWGQAKTHNHLGFIHARMGHHAKAVHHQQQAVRWYREAGDPTGEAWAQIGLGDAYYQGGDNDAGEVWFARGLDLARSVDYRPGQVLALIGMGYTRYERPLLEEALSLADAVGDRWSRCLALTGIGICHHHSGDSTQALTRLGQAAALARETGDRWALRLALTTLGRVLSQLGRHDEAITVHEEALALARELSNTYLETEVLGDLAALATSA